MHGQQNTTFVTVSFHENLSISSEFLVKSFNAIDRITWAPTCVAEYICLIKWSVRYSGIWRPVAGYFVLDVSKVNSGSRNAGNKSPSNAMPFPWKMDISATLMRNAKKSYL